MSPAPQPAPSKKPPPNPPNPLLRLEFRDLSEEGAKIFLSCHGFDCANVLKEAVDGVLKLLYSSDSHIPSTRSVTLVLRSMPGVAYTTGRDIDDDHKEIHFSTDYIAGIDKSRVKDELLGVIRHEMVHCWQWNANGTAPGGLIEGIADWVRLRSDFVPPHWSREVDGDWDAGYQHTGYFLDWLEDKYGKGTVKSVNDKLRNEDYDEEKFWKALFGHNVKHLWNKYGEHYGSVRSKEPKTPNENEGASAQTEACTQTESDKAQKSTQTS